MNDDPFYDDHDVEKEDSPVGIFLLDYQKMNELHLALTELKADNPGSVHFLDVGILENMRTMAEAWIERHERGGHYDA